MRWLIIIGQLIVEGDPNSKQIVRITSAYPGSTLSTAAKLFFF